MLPFGNHPKGVSDFTKPQSQKRKRPKGSLGNAGINRAVFTISHMRRRACLQMLNVDDGRIMPTARDIRIAACRIEHLSRLKTTRRVPNKAAAKESLSVRLSKRVQS